MEKGALWEEEEWRRSGRSEAEEDLEDCEEGAGPWGWRFFWVPLYVYDGRGIRLMWVGQAGVPWWFQKP